jgi:NADPH-dependent 2,4-dienoyl-CoA reductase/sulfur reductase-like enzyme
VGSAPEEWLPLRTPDFYQSIRVDLITGNPVVRIDPAAHKVFLRDGRELSYGSMLLATGAEPRSLKIGGADLPHVYRLRTLADSRALIAAAAAHKTCVVIGSSFIGLEVAASLRQRGVSVSVVGPDAVPLGKILGNDAGRFIQNIHEEHGVRFSLNTTPRAIHQDRVELANGSSIETGFVVMGVGVSPRTSLAEAAGLNVNNGVIVDEQLRTSAPDIFAAGDIARYPEHVSGEQTRIEHWVVAERQGQAAARAMLGIGKPFREVPFFWSAHYGVTISYVGHAASWDGYEIQGDLEKRDACVLYRRNGKIVAAATIGRDLESLKLETILES